MDKETILEVIRIAALGSGSKSISEIINLNRTSVINVLLEQDLKQVKSL